MSGNEGFYIENGVKRDVDIHDPILDGAPDDRKFRLEGYMAGIAMGLDPARLARLYGLEEGFDLGPGASVLR